MKKIIVTTLAIAMIAAVQAQEIPDRKTDKPHPEHKMHHKGRGGHNRGEMMKQLNLTEQQKEQFKTQREEFRKKMDDLKKNDNITVKEWKSRMETLRKEQKAKMDGILTKEQKAQLEKIKSEQKVKHEEMRKQHAEKMKTQLGLTDEQSAKLEKQRAETGEKIKAIREDKNLGDEQRREKIKELMKQQKENMKSLLTEEQLKKMKEIRKHHKPGMKRKPEEKKETT